MNDILKVAHQIIHNYCCHCYCYKWLYFISAIILLFTLSNIIWQIFFTLRFSLTNFVSLSSCIIWPVKLYCSEAMAFTMQFYDALMWIKNKLSSKSYLGNRIFADLSPPYVLLSWLRSTAPSNVALLENSVIFWYKYRTTPIKTDFF